MIDLEDGHREPLEARTAHTPPLDVIVTGVALVAHDTHQLTLESASGALLPGGGAGSHVDVILPNGLQRQYSLLDSGPQLQAYRIAVKLDPASRGGSRYIVGQLRVGDPLRVSHPRNNFPLYKDAAHSVFIAGGIGITPVLCMIRRLEALGRSWSLHYACRSRADAAYLGELTAMPEAHCHFDDEQGRLLDVTAVEAAAAPDAHLYCCGPVPMLAAFEAATAARPRNHVHVEYFTPRKAEAQVNAAGFVVALAKSGKEYVCRLACPS